MSLRDPFNDLQKVTAGQNVPKGTCDGLLVTAPGNLGFTTQAGTAIAPFAVVAGQLVSVRATHIDAATTATVYAGYH